MKAFTRTIFAICTMIQAAWAFFKIYDRYESKKAKRKRNEDNRRSR